MIFDISIILFNYIMYFIKLYYFYTVWSFCIHILGNIFDFNTYNLASVVFVASIFLIFII
jgi:hypothetical protein